MSHQFAPEVQVTLPGSSWPAEEGLPVGTGLVDEWSTTRELVASTLPGMIRFERGASVGVGQISIAQPNGKPLAPWAKSGRKVTAGQPCTLDAVDEATGVRESLGAWLVQQASGALTSAAVDLSLIESQYAGRTQEARLPTNRAAMAYDLSWVADELARQAGFFSTPPPSPSSIAHRTYCGARGDSYDMATGVVGASALTPASYGWVRPAADPWTTTITLNLVGTVIVGFFDMEAATQIEVRISPAGIALRWSGGAWSATAPVSRGLDPHWPTRVQVRLSASTAGANTAWSAVARSAHGAAWSSAATLAAAPNRHIVGTSMAYLDALSGGLSALEISDSPDPGPVVWQAPTAVIPLLGQVTVPWVRPDADVWTALAETVATVAGARWVSRGGVLTVIDRTALAGVGRPKTLVDVGERVEDLAWTIDADDYADRLEVTWWPVSWSEEGVPAEWPAADKLHVPAGQSRTVKVDLGGYVGDLYTNWKHVGTVGVGDGWSEWDANTASDGTGTVVTAGVTVTSEQTSPARVVVTVRNTTDVDVWMVDPAGQPALTVRGQNVATQETPALIELGAQASAATTPLAVDLGKLAQSIEHARQIADYIWARVSSPRPKIAGVRIPWDWTTDVGDVLTLTHPESDLLANALVTKVNRSSPLRLVVDLALLPPTGDEFDTAWAGKTGSDFDAVWAGMNGVAFDDDPLKTGA